MKKPNIILILTDDHGYQAISEYSNELMNTPNIDRLAETGIRMENFFCNNSLCAPSRASILTSQYSHLNGVKTLKEELNNELLTFPKVLAENNYQTALVGKWHLGHSKKASPRGFNYYDILKDQGEYYNPRFISKDKDLIEEGYVTNIITEKSLEWLKNRDKKKAFFLMCSHKAPHRAWLPEEKYLNIYKDKEFPYPPSFMDDFSTRTRAPKEANMRIEDLTQNDIKIELPEGLSPEEVKKAKYQAFIKDYCRCVLSVDDSVGELINYLKDEKIYQDTIIIYTSDQGFYLGEHGWYDKRFMYEHSFKTPFIISYPRLIKRKRVDYNLLVNIDIGPTLLDCADIEIPSEFQGKSFKKVLYNENFKIDRDAVYYRYWDTDSPHNVCPHYGIRTRDYKLIYFCKKDRSGKIIYEDWELYDLSKDHLELNNVFENYQYKDIVEKLKIRLEEIKTEFRDYE